MPDLNTTDARDFVGWEVRHALRELSGTYVLPADADMLANHVAQIIVARPPVGQPPQEMP